jgi:hypothetical protein
MNDIFQKTSEYIIPEKKHVNMLYPKTDIFNINKKEETRTGKRLVSMESLRNNGDYSGKRYRQMDEVHFNNINNEKY